MAPPVVYVAEALVLAYIDTAPTPATNPVEPALLMKLPLTVVVAEEALKIEPVFKVNGPLMVVFALPPWNVPPDCVYPPAPTVRVTPEDCVIVPVYPEVTVVVPTLQLELIVTLPFECTVYEEVGRFIPKARAVISACDKARL